MPDDSTDAGSLVQEEDRVGWGVIGCGWVARDFGIPAIQNASNSCLVGLCDRDEDALAATLPEGNAPFRTQEAGKLLQRDDLDAVYVATPNDSHADLVAACAEADKHILCEKPMARTTPEAKFLVDACRTAGVRYATAFDQRFHPAHARLRDLVADGALGTITTVRIRYACWTPADWTPDGISLDNWRVDPDRAGGGAFIDLAPHGLDLTQMILGEPLSSVSALLQGRVFDYPVDDGAALVARSESGTLLSQSVAYNCPDAFPRRRLEVIGTDGRALAVNTMGQDAGGQLTLMDSDGSEAPVEFDKEQSPFLGQVETFARSVRADEPFPFSPEHDLHTMRLVDAAVESSGTKVSPASPPAA